MTHESLATVDTNRLLLICQLNSMLAKQRERLWMTCPDLLLTDQPYPGLERLRATFHGHAYDPHRHATYAIGMTVIAGLSDALWRRCDRKIG